MTFPFSITRPRIGAQGTSWSGNDVNTKILLHMDGTNGGTTFTDSNVGGSAHTWTPTSATTSTGQIQFGTASMAVGGTGFVTTPASSDFNIGTSNFAAEYWFWVGGGAGANRFSYGQSNSSPNAGFSIGGALNTANQIRGFISFDGVNLGVDISGTTAITTTGWHHYAFTKNGTVYTLYLDGKQEAQTTQAGTINSSANKFGVGCLGEFVTQGWNGFIDEFRLSVGDTRWTSNFSLLQTAYAP